MKKCILFILLILSACTSSDRYQNPKELLSISIETADFDQIIYSCNDIVNDYYYIPLETIDSINLIGKIDKIEIYDSIMFVLDKNITKTIFIFDINGSYINKIDDIGEGPGEYIEPYDFTLDTVNKHIILYCHKAQKLIFYHFNGSFIKEQKIGLSLRSLELKNDKYLFFTHSIYNYHDNYGDLNYDYIVIDTSLKLITKQFPNGMQLNKPGIVFNNGSYFSKNSGDIYLSTIFNDTVYKINEKCNAIPFCYFDFGSSSIPPQVFDEKEDVYIYNDVVIEAKYSCKFASLEFTNTLGLVDISVGISNEKLNGFYCILFTKDLKSKLLFKDISYGNYDGVFRFPISNIDDYFISVIYPEELLVNANFNSTSIPLNLKGVNKSIAKFDNPILMFTKFKGI